MLVLISRHGSVHLTTCSGSYTMIDGLCFIEPYGYNPGALLTPALNTVNPLVYNNFGDSEIIINWRVYCINLISLSSIMEESFRMATVVLLVVLLTVQTVMTRFQ